MSLVIFLLLYFTGEIPKLLLEDENIDPNAKNHDGHTPFSLAFRHMDSTLVKLLVRDGRSSLNENDGSGNSPQLLHWACARRDKELVQLLVRDERCNPHEKDSNGDTALHVACRHNETSKTYMYIHLSARYSFLLTGLTCFIHWYLLNV